MKRFWLALVLCTFLSTSVSFAYWGTYDTTDISTIKSEMRDDWHVMLTGKLVKHLHKDKYMFEDASGEQITVELDDDHHYNIDYSRSVRIYGEVDVKKNGRIEIEVDRMEIL